MQGQLARERCGTRSAPHCCALQLPVPALRVRTWQRLLQAKENKVDFEEALNPLHCVSKGHGGFSVPI